MAGVLNGIKVLDLTSVYSGPFSTLLLRDLGAEVIKLERPESGDMIRYDIPHTEANEGGPFIILNRGKKSLTVDLKTEKGRNICKELAKKVDVLVENFSPGTMDKLGLDSKTITKLNPKIIYASISAYGQTGPLRDYPGFDPVSQAMGGMVAVTGFPDQPVRSAVSIADFTSGMFMTMSIVAALYHRLATGEGQVIDISMQDCIWQLTSIEYAPYYFMNGVEPPRLGNQHAAMIPCNIYTAKDGGRVIINAGVLSQLHRLYGVMGRNDLLNTPLGGNQSVRFAHRKEIDDLVAEWVKTKNTAEIQETLKKADVPCTRVPAFSEVCHDPQLLSRNMIIDVEQTLSGKVKAPGSIFKMSKTPGKIDYGAPFLGENTNEVLTGMLGLSDEEIAKLSDEHII
jgi:crotonobetainyl-CoA:carnitine CoA-transferase CaiB-like acyl-CoA transferase